MIDWEESVFVGLKSLWRRLFVAPREAKANARQVSLGDLRQELFLLGHLVAGRSIQLFETQDEFLCSENYIFLPSRISVASSGETNAEIYRIKTIVGGLAIREGWTGDIEELIDLHKGELPFLRKKIARVQASLPDEIEILSLLGTISTKAKIADRDENQEGLVAHDMLKPEGDEGSETVEIEGQGRTEVEVIESREDFGAGGEMPEHAFEKVETLEEYDGQSRKSEADEDLEHHEEALNELNMSKIMRSTDRPRSIYRADLLFDSIGFDVVNQGESTGIPYPEWNYKSRKYRANWCFVRETRLLESDPDWVGEVTRRRRRLIEQLRRQFATVSSEWLKVKRQAFGPDFDLDAVIAFEVDRRSNQVRNEAVYQNRNRDVQDCAALLLFDQSYSTDSWVDDDRVLDTIRETIFCCSEVLQDYLETFAIAGFSSNTRQDCRFEWVKNFDEPWEKTRGRLGTIEALGYTRIGPALRHAQEVMINVAARRKIIILVTDGRPCDYDRYEGAYGIHDVKKAIEAGRKEGIQTHAYAIEKRAAEYFPRMFTADHYDIIPNPDELARSLCRLFLRLRGRR